MFINTQIYHKKSASYVLRTIAKHNADLSRFVVDAGAVPLLKTVSVVGII